jgi:hypothetical protein
MWIIKPGFFEKKQSGKRQPGLDLSRAVGDWLRSIGALTTTDCCHYYPTVPLVKTASVSAPTQAEMENIPLWGMFRTTNSSGSLFYIFIKTGDNSVTTIATND